MIAAVIVFAYLAVVLYIGIFAFRRRGHAAGAEDYFLAGRTLGPAVFLLSLGGFPPMAGFIAKWYIFSAAVQEGHYWLAVIGVLTSVISVFFYLRIVVMMYMTAADEPVSFPPISKTVAVALIVVSWIVLILASLVYLGPLLAQPGAPPMGANLPTIAPPSVA